jgi:nitrite reductase (NADH) large subunit
MLAQSLDIAPESSRRQRLVVIGNGMAGARAVEDILARDGADQYRIAMFGEEPYGNYNRILLSNVMNGSEHPESIFLNALPWYRENDIRLHAGERAVHIDRIGKRVYGSNGTVESYDKLLIATGSSPYFPPIEGLFHADGTRKAGIFGFRTLDDCNAIVALATRSRRTAVIGGGLLGLEAAHGLLAHGCEVHVIHRSNRLMNQQLDEPASAILRGILLDMGVKVHLEKATKAIVGDDRVTGLAFSDGSTLDCDLVVVSTGIQPNTWLAVQCGLSVERGIVVDNQMRSVDDPDIYAVGECAQHRGMVYGLVAPLWEQAKVLAEHLTGKNPNAGYYGSKLGTKLKVMGIELASMGIANPEQDGDEVVQFSEPKRGKYKKLVIRNGRLVGAILLGDLDKVAFLTQAFERNAPLPEERLSLLFDLGGPAKATTFAEMSPDCQVCNCNGVSKAAVEACVTGGKRTALAVMQATRAGMGCGACKTLVAELTAFFAGGALEEDPRAHYYVPNVPYDKPALTQKIRELGLKSVSAVLAALGTGEDEPASNPALASLLSVVWKHEFVDERDARFINDRVHGNIQKDGTFSVVPEIPGGVCTPEELRRIADVAEKYRVPLLKLTGGQRLDLVGVKKEDLPAVWRELGMRAGYAWAKSYRTCKSCIGVDYCRFGLGDSMELARKIEERYRGLETPGKLKLATAGCPRNCSEALVKDVGVVAVEGGRWELYVGGAAGAHVRKGDLLCTVDTHEAVLRATDRFLQYYREHAKYKERTYTFVERMGIDRVRAVVNDDSERRVADLDRAMAEAVAASKDPWLERDAPVTPNQFRTHLPLVGGEG